MREKIKRILDLIRAEKLTLDDAAPLLAALSPKLALAATDRELVSALLARPELDTGQVAEHLMLLRGVREAPPAPPSPPQAPRRPQVIIGGARPRGLDSFLDRLPGEIEDMVGRVAEEVERSVGSRSWSHGPHSAASSRILRVHVESQHGDEYKANIPVSLAPHLGKLIPPHGIAALEAAGFSLETLQLLLEANPAPGPLIEAEDKHGNEVHISLK
ncbi:hypothetical protein K7W42_06935 [Deinococcus sp. HMF7604]|uniref:hypothetical protein n=1 Tax=Deinococcus betulae TaxID=2873312 RepID=UPI001CCD91F2|nr:hypothetical protein [Deinococcus betulae]MBZ9750593.1 hypothetical protein [Deinococcus betulae]